MEEGKGSCVSISTLGTLPTFKSTHSTHGILDRSCSCVPDSYLLSSLVRKNSFPLMISTECRKMEGEAVPSLGLRSKVHDF